MAKLIPIALLALLAVAGCSNNSAPGAPDKIGAPPPAASQALRPPQAK